MRSDARDETAVQQRIDRVERSWARSTSGSRPSGTDTYGVEIADLTVEEWEDMLKSDVTGTFPRGDALLPRRIRLTHAPTLAAFAVCVWPGAAFRCPFSIVPRLALVRPIVRFRCFPAYQPRALGAGRSAAGAVGESDRHADGGGNVIVLNLRERTM